MNPGEGDPSQVGVVRLVLRRHKYCNTNPSIISLLQEMNPEARVSVPEFLGSLFTKIKFTFLKSV
jgi:hypothetical protein